ncbi:TraR/DksA family transcriptional regulator [Microbacterium sp. W1N]|uniref:TraR/DksA family transcriptional regulator n=1 Tax=Microbacterium festucae TaxID=2977531 RepID=UPI0021BF7068|nr:TraR/DksA family transcriptional regulator [Microbacterium festucae]MCT9819938.1 TraR/DksA family transcriptional regulator [Microbacterium festucae]
MAADPADALRAMSARADALRAMSARADAQLAAVERELAELRGARGAESADDEHDPEGVTLSGEWSRLAGVREGLVAERAGIQDALARVDAGDYGVCVDCGTAIAPERLAVRPTATRCVACAERAGR